MKLVKVFAAAALVSGCDDGLASSESIRLTHAADELAAAEDREMAGVIAEFQVGDAGILRFVDESASARGGGVGMLAINIPRFSATVSALELTPLELYRALAPGEQVPEVLRKHHIRYAELHGRGSPEPREVMLEGEHLIGDFAAGPQQFIFAQDTGTMTNCSYGDPDLGHWSNTYCPDIQNNQGGYDSCSTDGSASGNATPTNAAALERWLGICVYDTADSVGWVVQSFSGGSWLNVVGTSTNVVDSQWVEYFSSGTSMAFRSVITASSSEWYQWGKAID